VQIGRGVVLRHAIIDKGCVLPDRLTVGVNPHADSARCRISPRGITLVTPGMLLPTDYVPVLDSTATPPQSL